MPSCIITLYLCYMNILVPKKERKTNPKRKKKKENYPITNYDCIGGGI